MPLDFASSVRLILFDLDGTLVDSAPDLALSVNQMLAELDLPQCGEAPVRGWVGDGIDALIERAMHNALGKATDEASFERALAVFRRCYAANNGALSRPYEGAMPLLDSLRAAGLRLGCVTNKAQAFTEPLLDQMQLLERLDCVLSGDQVSRKKPHPDILLAACEQIGVGTAEALLVGDSRNDVRAARAAAMPVVAVSYGYSQGEDVHALGADAVVDDLREVTALLGVD